MQLSTFIVLFELTGPSSVRGSWSVQHPRLSVTRGRLDVVVVVVVVVVVIVGLVVVVGVVVVVVKASTTRRIGRIVRRKREYMINCGS